jgi:hypothetical protein
MEEGLGPLEIGLIVIVVVSIVYAVRQVWHKLSSRFR